MKIEISLQDIFPEGGEDYNTSLSEMIKEHITGQVKQMVWQKVEIKAKELADTIIKHHIETVIAAKVDSFIKEVVDTDKLKKRYSNNEMVTINEWIKDELVRLTVDRYGFGDGIKAQGEKLTQELKQRYDLVFATHIVKGLQEQGMLKDDVAKILTEGKK